MIGPTTVKQSALFALLSLVLSVSAHDLEDDACTFSIAQTTPDNLTLSPMQDAELTAEALVELIKSARSSLKIASFYMELTPQQGRFEELPAAKIGAQVREAIKEAAGSRGVNVELILDHSDRRFVTNQADVAYLKKAGVQVKFLDMRSLFGRGMLHTSLLLADDLAFYVGSANLDWRAYGRLNELGVVARKCPTLAKDLDKIFRTYSLMTDAEEARNFEKHLDEFTTKINLTAPLVADGLKVVLAGSPPVLNGRADQADRRTDDIDALLYTIETAQHQIDISVMDYDPRLLMNDKVFYWSVIDDALRQAAIERKVRVRLLLARWSQTKPRDLMWYKSLNDVQPDEDGNGGIHVKLFEVPTYDEWLRSLPYDRVKHEKYVVTDAGLYVGTNSWSPNYFAKACGVSLVLEPMAGASSKLVKTARDLFERNFNSEYAHELVVV